MKAITLPFLNRTIYLQKQPSKELINHENIHLEQIKKEGSVKFALSYSAQFLLKGYENISYEVEANRTTKTITKKEIQQMNLLRIACWSFIVYKGLKFINH